jgi:lysozyme
MKPNSKPQMIRDAVEQLALPYNMTDKVYLVGIRGYYEDTMGEKGKNDRGIYDDAIFIVSPDQFHSFNANCDPSIKRKNIATLVPGVHMYRKGKHGISKPGGGYPALRPATKGEALPVMRDEAGLSMGIAINIHKGSYRSTSSEGCQTIYPDQWQEFITRVYKLMDQYNQKTIPYLLIAN